MKTYFKNFVLALCAVFGLATLTAAPVSAEGYDICANPNLSTELKQAYGCADAGTGETLPTVIENILEIVIGIAGLVAVIAIIIGGIGYMTSAGDAGKLKKAKDTILYACIGLVVCALAFGIVNFTIHAINGSASTPSGDPETGEVVEPEE